MDIKEYFNIDTFYKHNKDYIEGNKMLNYFLINKIQEVYNRQTKCYKCFSIIDENNTTLVLIVTDICLIYSNCNDVELFPILTKELEFHKFLRYTFAGTKQIIEGLLNYNKSNFSVQKHLIIYCYNTLFPSFQCSIGKMELAKIDNLESLISMNISFKKEYNEEIVSYDDAKFFVQNGISQNNLYV